MNLPRVFMIGWEFPPYNSGGLGTACHGLTSALADLSISQVLLLPKDLPLDCEYIEIANPYNSIFTQVHINHKVKPYTDGVEMSLEQRLYLKRKQGHIFNPGIVNDAYDYAGNVGSVCQEHDYDIIHAHDWFTFPAAIETKKISNKPTVLHVHSTEFDRTLNGNINPYIADIEKNCLNEADRVITVSEYTKNMVANKYHIAADKIEVVHNGIDLGIDDYYISDEDLTCFARNRKIVIFVGRLTAQKGPDYFVSIAKKITDHVPNALFVIAGSGDMQKQIIFQAAQAGLTGKLLFSGFLRGRQKSLLYKRADLFIMPSISEPFGIVALEAASNYTPVIISKQSGVSEVFRSALRANYWDTDIISSHAISVLTKPKLHKQLSDSGYEEVRQITWHKAAQKCLKIYQELVN